jgi:molybdopterin-guanine dinucleotide biosynthesis protein MobB
MGAEELRVPVVCFVGRKNSGKTTLMEKVIAGLKAAGYRVAAVKHDAHRFEIDHPGKDSYRFSAAGADATVISSRDKTAVVLHHGEELSLESILSRFVEGVDFVLAEGYKASRFPKIEVHRKATGEPLLHPPPGGLIAVATDERVDTAVPQLDIQDSGRLVELIQKKYLGAEGRA